MSAYDQALRRELTREQLAALSAGGSPERPIAVTSMAVIEPRTLSLPCTHCGGEYRIHEHTARWHRVRRVDARCRHCSAPRTLWFRLVEHEPN